MSHATYRKINDGTGASSTYHKKDGTEVRAVLKRDAEREVINQMMDNLQSSFAADGIVFTDRERGVMLELAELEYGYE